MELRRHGQRSVCLAMVLSSLICTNCWTALENRPDSNAPPPPKIIDEHPTEGRPTVAILTPATEQTLTLWRSLADELGETYNVATLTVTSNTKTTDIAQHVRASRPACVVLIDNRTVALYRDYQKQTGNQDLPVVILMTSFLSEIIADIPNAVGIAYEVPGVMSFVRLRSILVRPVRKIGVVHRSLFEPFIQKQKHLAQRERFEVIQAEVSDHPDEDELMQGLATLIDEHKVDALWVLNDNVLLTPELITRVWLKKLHKRRVPTIVNVSSLVNPKWDFGTLGISPDHEALGMQAANLIYDLADKQWQLTAGTVELPLSIQSMVDIRQVKRFLKLKPDALGKIDQIVE